jgi:hypothetical protein
MNTRPLPRFGRKLPAKYNVVAIPLCLSLVMSGVVSLVAMLRTVGLHDGLLDMWLHAWMASWCVAGSWGCSSRRPGGKAALPLAA